MPKRPSSRVIAPVAMACGLALATLAPAADWQALVGNSPFGQSNAPAATSTGGEIEFRGVVEEGGVQFINLYDPATKTSHWIPVKGQTQGLTVQSYSSSTEKVEVAQAGRILTLPLKQTRVALVQAPPPAAPGAPGVPPPEGGAGNAENRAAPRDRAQGQENNAATQTMRNLPPEAQAMIEEFRRRRANRATGQPLNVNNSAGQPSQSVQPIRQP